MSYPGALYPGTTYPGEFTVLDPSSGGATAGSPSGAPVALLGWDESPLRIIQGTDWLLDDRADSTNQVRVTTSLAEADGVDAEQELIFKERGFTISGVERDRAADEAVITADEHQAALADVVIVGFRPNSWTLTRAMNAVLEGTRWTLGEVSGTRYGRADFDEITALDALHFLARHQDAKLSFDSLRRRVNITQDTGTVHEYVFTYGRQLSNIEKDVQQPVTTVIYPTMADDVVLDPVEDYGYYLSQGISLAEAKARFRKEEYWDDSRYEIAENMTRDAQKRLEEEAYPRVTYTLTAQATLDVDGVDDFGLAELHLGDTVYVWDQETDTKLSAEVTAVTTSSDQSENELVLSTLPASLGDSVESRGYFGDSGRPSSGGWDRVIPRSGPQPRPSMPIKESVSSTGVGTFRWNGQDHEGNFDTIPARFGHVRPRVARLLEDGTVPSPESADAFGGTTITTYDGGTCIVSFGAPGEYAVWFQMVGADGQTVSEHSEPWVGVIDEHVDTEAIEQALGEAEDRLAEAEADFTEGNEQRKAEIEHLREVRIPELQDELATGLDDVYREAQQYAESQADNAVNQAAANAQSEYDRLQEIAERALSRAGDNVLEDPSFETDYWFDYFEGSGTRPYTPTSVHRTGDQAMEIGEGSNFWLNFDTFDVEEGESWRLTIWYRTSGSPSMGNTRLALRDQIGGTQLAASDAFTVSESEFRRAVVTYTVPPGVDQLVPALYPNFSDGTMIIDDIALQEVGAAAEALRMAEVARQEAEAAHIAAGNAVDAAASAYDAASSKSTIHWSLSEPSGTADNTDDVWWRYELRNGRRVVIGQWFWDNGVWRETEIAEEWLPLVNIGTGTYGDMSGDRLTAHTIQANHLLVGARNIVSDTEFDTLENGDNLSWWSVTEGAWYKTSISSSDRTALRISNTHARDSETYTLWWGGGVNGDRVIPCEPGDTFKIRFQVGRYGDLSVGDDDGYRVQVRWRDAAGQGVGWTTSTFGHVSNGAWHEVEATVPDGVAFFGVRWQKLGVAENARAIADVSLEKMTDTSLIVRGAVKSHSVDTEEFFAAVAVIERLSVSIARAMEITAERGFIGGALLEDETVTTPKLAVTDEMVARFAQFLRVQVDMLDFNRMVGMAIESGLIEGGTVRGAQIETTGQSAREIKIDGNGISGYNSSGTRNFHVNTSGHLTAQNATVEGHILAQTARLIGELRVGTRAGGDGEGGIVPTDNNSRIRLIGRMPSSASSTDTFVSGWTPYLNRTANYGFLDLYYGNPAPTGDRIPQLMASINSVATSWRGTYNLTTQGRVAARVRVHWTRDHRSGTGGPASSFSYLATWGVATPGGGTS